jgi:hypothetical protein
LYPHVLHPHPQPKRLRLAVLATTAAVFALGLGFVMGFVAAQAARPPLSQTPPDAHAAAADLRAPPRPLRVATASGVLVLYSFFEGDEVSWDNLRFFTRHAVRPGDGAQYVLVLNGVHSLADARLPPLPPNARYVLHANECYDWGAYAWALDTQAAAADYKCALQARGAQSTTHASGCVYSVKRKT